MWFPDRWARFAFLHRPVAGRSARATSRGASAICKLARAYVKCLICRPSPSASAPKAWDRASMATKIAGGHRAGGHLDMHRGSGPACDAASRHRLGPAASFCSQCHVRHASHRERPQREKFWLMHFLLKTPAGLCAHCMIHSVLKIY